MLAPVYSVSGVTRPSGEIGDSLYKLLSAQLRFRVSSALVFTKTNAWVVSSGVNTSSGAFFLQPVWTTRRKTIAQTPNHVARRAGLAFVERSDLMLLSPLGIPSVRPELPVGW